MAAKITEISPGAVVLINEVPKHWVDYEIYCQLIPNSDDSVKTYKILPRIGSFEISFKGVVGFERYIFKATLLEAALGHVALLRRGREALRGPV